MLNEVADETLLKIGAAIGSDPSLLEDWISLDVVFKVRGGVVGHNAAMITENSHKEVPFLLSSDNEATRLIQRLQAATLNDDGTSWVACKIDLIRATRDHNIAFEYHDEKRWDAPLPF